MAFPDLRAFLDELNQEGDLLQIDDPLSPEFEIIAVVKKLNDGPAALINNVIGYPGVKVASNVLGTRRRMARLLGVPVAQLNQTFMERKDKLIDPVITREAPVKEVIHRGNINLPELLPVLTYHEKDAGPYMTAGFSIARDPVTGKQNIGLHRLQVKGGNRLGIFLSNPPIAAFFDRAEEAGQPLEIAIAIGVDPALALAAIAKATAAGPDKMAIAGGLRGEPIELIQAETVDLLVPARAEVILEGKVLPGIREDEGPFGESTGNYFTVNGKVIEIQAVTYRKEFIFQAIQPWGSETDTLLALAANAETLTRLKEMVPALEDLSFVPGTCSFHAVAVVKPTTPAEVRRLIGLILNMERRIKQVIVVDNDVDIYDFREVQWALSTRFQADPDLIVIPGLEAYVIDPSAKPGGLGAKMGLDATKKGNPERFEKIRVPEAAANRAAQVLAKKR